MNQYQACLDSFECIFHNDSKYSITKFPHVDIFYKMCYILVLSSAHARRVVSVLNAELDLISDRGFNTVPSRELIPGPGELMFQSEKEIYR